MTYCTIQEVKDAINYPEDAPVSDVTIQRFILDAEEEIENIYKTKFGDIADSGTTTGDLSTTTFSDSTKIWDVDEFVGYVVYISGQYREITANTKTKITVSPAFGTAPLTSVAYKILKLGYIDQTVDGTGTEEMFVQYQPLVNLNSLTIDSTSIDVDDVYQYKNSGKLVLSYAATLPIFANKTRQLINLKYVYGVYPIPRIIRRLCVCLAGVRTLTSQISGTYDDFTSVSLPGGFTGSKGEPYTNIRASLDYLQGEARGIVYGTQSTGQVSGDLRTVPSFRPYTIFG